MHQYVYLFKQAWASLRKKPGFVVTIVMTMGTTLGALMCVLTLAYLLLVEPFPYPEQDKLYKVVHVMGDPKGEHDTEWFTYPGLMHLYHNQQVFSQTALLSYGQEVLSSEPDHPSLYTSYATPEWFELLGANIHLGRLFEQSETLDTFNPVAIISYQTWRDRFAGDPDILDRKVTFRGISYRVVGVLDKAFVEPQLLEKGRKTDVWIPWDFNKERQYKDLWYGITELVFVGKLKAGLSISAVEQTLTPLVNNKWQENVSDMPFFKGWAITMRLQSFQSVILGDSRTTLYLLIAGIMGLVLIASANIGNLFMTRTAQKKHTLAIHASVGATSKHIFKNLLAESLILMGLSCLLGLFVSASGFYLMRRYLAQSLPRIDELTSNSFTFLCAALLTGLFALGFAFIGNKLIQHRQLNMSLQGGNKGAAVQVNKGIRQILIVSQVAIASLLVFANINLFNQAMLSIQAPSELKIDNVTHLDLSVASTTQPDAETSAVWMQEFKYKLQQLPEVDTVTQSYSAMDYFRKWALTDYLSNQRYVVESKQVDAYYFPLLGQSLLEGRFFSEQDVRDTNRVLIINDVLAKTVNPNGSALGTRFTSEGGAPYTVIGVVKGAPMPASSDMPPRVYRPSSLSLPKFSVKMKDHQHLTKAKWVEALQHVTQQFVILSSEQLTETKDRLLFSQYVTAIVSATLALVTLFLAAIGLFGILSYSSQMRRFELGTRLALGAKRRDIIVLIIKDTSSVIISGLVISFISATAGYLIFADTVAPLVGNTIFPVIGVTLVSISTLAVLACYWPLRKYINQPVIYSLRSSD